MKLSLITPAFSEEATIGKLLDLVLASPTAAEAIVDEQVSSSGAFSPAFSDVGGTAGARPFRKEGVTCVRFYSSR